ncbi:MAG: acyltransferase [Acidimicrobiales bacterium]|nr:acyltransferase [Acidimicrobiales bacterium]
MSTTSLSELGAASSAPRSSPPLAPTGPGAHGGFAFQPGLEGMRGAAVLAVLVFHGGFSWASGGFLGVSTFFTLSGFLISTLLLHERHRTGSVALKRFWARRFRRLMPAALVCLVGVLVFAATVATPAQMVDLRGDMIASLLYVANWRFIADGASYAELFAAPSPVLHFWSLAIEEQFYLVFPLVVAGCLALAKGSRRLLAGLLAIGTVASVALTASLAESSIDAAYYNTFSRAAELLLGALLAIVVALPVTRRALDHGRATIAVTVAGAIASIAVVWLWHTAAQTDAWLYRGGLAGYALLSTLLIVAAVEAGPLRRMFSTTGLRWLGRISYGAYLYHWPIFLWLTPARTGLSEVPLFGLRMGVTLGAAVLSYRLIEEPIRAGRLVRGWHPFVVAPVAVALVLLGIIRVATPTPLDDRISFAAEEQPEIPEFVAAEASAPTVPATVPATTPPAPLPDGTSPAPPLPDPPIQRPGEKLRVLLVGDSVMASLGLGIQGWSQSTGNTLVWNNAELGCGTGRGGSWRFVERETEISEGCNQMRDTWAAHLAAKRPHVVVLMAGTWDVVDRKLPGDDQWRTLGDPVYDRFMRQEITYAIDVLQGQGSTVVLLTHPAIRSGITEQLPGPFPESDPARMARLNELFVEVAATRPRSRVVDLAGHMAARPQGELDLTERPDGIHWTRTSGRPLGDWLGPLLESIARDEPTEPGAVIMSS